MYSTYKCNKIVIFDMDETLGHFEQISIFWNALNNYYRLKNNYNLSNKDFYNLIDLFIIYLRYDILSILNYIKSKKISNNCDNVIIYTNNSNKVWCNMIKDYFNYKLNYYLIDYVIEGYNNSNNNRTTNEKTLDDLIRCSHIPKNSKIVFIDDLIHKKMIDQNVTYIHVIPYIIYIPFDIMINHYYSKNKKNIDNYQNFHNFIKNSIIQSRYSFRKPNNLPLEHYINTSKHIYTNLDKFFK